jgi:hypothetical protein
MFNKLVSSLQKHVVSPLDDRSLILYRAIIAGYDKNREPGSAVGIATGYGLDGPGVKSRWGARFSAPVRTGPGANPASCTMGTGVFPE